MLCNRCRGLITWCQSSPRRSYIRTKWFSSGDFSGHSLWWISDLSKSSLTSAVRCEVAFSFIKRLFRRIEHLNDAREARESKRNSGHQKLSHLRKVEVRTCTKHNTTTYKISSTSKTVSFDNFGEVITCSLLSQDVCTSRIVRLTKSIRIRKAYSSPLLLFSLLVSLAQQNLLSSM